MSDSDQKLSKAPRRVVKDDKRIETANSLDIGTYFTKFLSQQTLTSMESEITDKVGRKTDLMFLSARSLKTDHKDIFEACFKLIEDSSANDYKTSEMKWSSAKKKREMILPDMRYIVLSENTSTSVLPSESVPDGKGTLKTLGFISFMLTYEDNLEVLYVYEIHLDVELRSQGVGTVLMTLVESIGRKAGVEKCMLTVFKSNRKAVKWYQRCGYDIDAYSPGPRILRNGKVKESSYSILSKPLTSDASAMKKDGAF